ATFLRSKLRYEMRYKEHHRVLLNFHRELLRFRRLMPALKCLSKAKMDVFSLEDERVLIIRRWDASNEVVAILNFRDAPVELRGRIPGGSWHTRMDSSDRQWLGPGSRVPPEFTTESLPGLSVCATSVVLLERHVED